MSPMCQLEMTLPRGFPGGVWGDGSADERWGAAAARGPQAAAGTSRRAVAAMPGSIASYGWRGSPRRCRDRAAAGLAASGQSGRKVDAIHAENLRAKVSRASWELPIGRGAEGHCQNPRKLCRFDAARADPYSALPQTLRPTVSERLPEIRRGPERWPKSNATWSRRGRKVAPFSKTLVFESLWRFAFLLICKTPDTRVSQKRLFGKS
jgi:hypothetical protein